MVIHGITLLMRAARTMRETLHDLMNDSLDPENTGVTFGEYKTIVGFDDWAFVENEFGHSIDT